MGPMMQEGPAVLFERVNKHFGAYHALRDIDLRVAQGEKSCDLRSLRLRKIDADPLHQPANHAGYGAADGLWDLGAGG